MRIYSLSTDFTDDGAPRFSWKCESDRRGDFQSSYKITVAADKDFSDIVWDSGTVNSDNTLYIKYVGKPLAECSDYYWRVRAADSTGEVFGSETARFETYKKGTDKSSWYGAEWIGAPRKTVNPSGVKEYSVTADFRADKTTFAVNARNKDNCTLFEIDIKNRRVTVYELCDNAWSDNVPYKRVCGRADGYPIAEDAVMRVQDGLHSARICVENSGACVSVYVDGARVIDSEPIMPKNVPNQPYKDRMFGFGVCQSEGKAEFLHIAVETGTGNVLAEDCFKNDNGALSALGIVKEGRLIVENEFHITSLVLSVNVRRVFALKGTVKRARLYASAMGFYEAYINGKKAGEDFYNPGFTDYRRRIMYQTYDVTDMLADGVNTVGATILKGYYSGYIGYNANPMIYGEQNYFIAQLLLEYADGTREIISTDRSWQFTDKGAVIDADYLQGETHDARLEFDWNDLGDKRWKQCGAREWPEYAEPTNGTLDGVRFELCPQTGPTARVERIIKPISECWENPRGHFVYDMGQNMVGTVRLRIRGRRGTSIKLRYAEMCRKNGEIYIENLRTAANTDVYTLRGDENGEEFVPRFTSHGFRYVEITGNGFELTKGDIKTY